VKDRNNGQEPGHRRRLDKEAQLARDQQLYGLKVQGWSYAEIADEMGMPKSSVQRCVERAAKAAGLQLNLELDAALAQYDSKVQAEDVTSPDQIGLLDDLQYHRLRYLALDDPVRQHWADAIAAGYRRPPPPPPGPVNDYPRGWRDGLAQTTGMHDPGGHDW